MGDAIEVSRAEKMLHPRLVRLIRELGYETLLPVQEKSIPVILTGAHTIVTAPTGSGKTEAALLPVLSQMIQCREAGRCPSGVLLVYVTPLRALNRDILDRVEHLVHRAGFTIMVRHGDTTSAGRRRFIRERPDVMITTPESLNLLLTVHQLRDAWSNVRWVIVDELHEFIDSERGSELAVILERLQRLSRHRVQRIGLSATLSRRTLQREATALLASGRRVEIVEDPTPKRYDITIETVSQGDDFWSRAARRVAEIVERVQGKVLVFVNTRSTAERLGAELAKSLGDKVAVHHGSLARHVREKAEREFKKGEVRVLVATSSMELGVDIGEVELVVQFLSPRSVITMAQRAGRAGHRFGETSKAVIVTSENVFEVLESAVIAFRAMHGHLEDQRMHRNPLDALAHQIVGLAIEEKGEGVPLGWLYDFVTRTAPFSVLGYEDFEDVVMHLDGVRIVRLGDDDRLRLGGRAYRYFYRVSMIPDERNYSVYDVLSGEKVGELSERFVESQLMRSEDGDRFRFVLAGKVWEALDIDPERGRVEARLIGMVEGYYPSWEGELIPVDYKVAREVCSILSLCMVDEDGCKRLLRSRRLEQRLIDRIVRIARDTAKAWAGITLAPLRPVVEAVQGGAVLYTCLGSKGNFTLALLISAILERQGVKVVFSHIPYAIVFRSPLGLRPRLIVDALLEASKLDPVQRRALVEAAVRESVAFMIRFVQVAKRMGVVDPDKSVPRELLKKLVHVYRGTVVEREALREIIYDKLDFNALNELLDNLESVELVRVETSTPLQLEVLENPYLRRDKAVDIRQIALATLKESFKRRIRQRRVILLCTRCGRYREATIASVNGDTRCPYCGSRSLAVLPTTEWGRKALEAFREYLEKRRANPRWRPRGEKARLVKEVLERATLFLEYYVEGLTGFVVEALSAHGVGPQRARKLLSTLVLHGEDAYYKELFRAMEEYAATRRFWDSRRKPANR